MEASQRYTACVQVVEVMEQGFSWHEAASRAGIKISQSTAYRLCQRMRQGESKRFTKADTPKGPVLFIGINRTG